MTCKRQSIRCSFMPSGEPEVTENPLSPKAFKLKLTKKADESIASLKKIWLEAGYGEEEKENLMGCFLTKLQDMFDKEVKDEEQILEHAKKQVKQDFKQYCDNCVRLGRSHPQSEDEVGDNYTDKLAELETMNENIFEELSSREQLLNSAIREVNNLSIALGEEVPSVDSYSGPEGTPELSDIRVTLLNKIKTKLDKVKAARCVELQSAMDQCSKCITDMSIDTVDELNTFCNATTCKMDLEQDLAQEHTEYNHILLNESLLVYNIKKCSEDFFTSVGIHPNDVIACKLHYSCLDQEKQKRKKDLASTGSEIARLWTLLRTVPAEREAFQNSFKMNLSRHTLNAGYAELSRLKVLRASSFKSVIESIRKDILGLWNERDGASLPTSERPETDADASVECVEARKLEFELYFNPIDTLVDEGSVEAHEAYFETLKKSVEEMRPLYSRLARRESIIQDRDELEIIQRNPERLTARGPNAREARKKEEAMITRVRGLDKLTKDLTSMIHNWEKEHKTSFIYAGECYLARIKQQETTFQDARDALRNARKRKDSTGLPPPSAKVLRKSNSASVSASKNITKESKETVVLPLNTKNLNSLIKETSDTTSKTKTGNQTSNRYSSDTTYTSATEVKDRSSTCTVLKGTGTI